MKKPPEREFFVEIAHRGFFASPEKMITIREVNYRTSAALMEYSATVEELHGALQRMRRKGHPSKKRIVIPIHRLERDLINSAKWSILRGISPEEFVAIAHRAFKQAANLITSTQPNHQ